MRAVHFSVWVVVLLVAIASAASQEDVRIRITGPVQIIVGSADVAGPQDAQGPTVSPNLDWLSVGSDRFVRFAEQMTWPDARARCRSHGLDLFHPTDPQAVSKYLNDTFLVDRKWSSRWSNNIPIMYWLGARGNGSHMVWLSEDVLTGCDPFYITHRSKTAENECLELMASGPMNPLTVGKCADDEDMSYVLCGSFSKAIVPTTEQCTGQRGFCVETGDRCSGTIEILYNSCNDHCSCCVPDKQVITVPPNLNLLSVGSEQFVRFTQKLNWNDARDLCISHGLDLFEPKEFLTIQQYLNNTFPEERVWDSQWSYDRLLGHWLGARGNGTYKVWLSGDAILSCTDEPFWGDHVYHVDTDDCLLFLSHAFGVLAANKCEKENYVLCGCVDCILTTSF